jgi:hypothetical protein
MKQQGGVLLSFPRFIKNNFLQEKAAEATKQKGENVLWYGFQLSFCERRNNDHIHIHNENYVHSWLKDTVEAHQLLLDKIVCFAMSDFGRTHAAFRLKITCAVRRYGFLLRTLPPQISADRTLLMQIGPFVQQFTDSWAFLWTHKHSIN